MSLMRRRSPLNKETMPTNRQSYAKVPSSPNRAAFQIAYDLEGGKDGGAAASSDTAGLLRVAGRNRLRCLSALAFVVGSLSIGMLLMRRGEFDSI